MISQIPTKEAKYKVGFTDADGVLLSVGANYRVNLTPNLPAGNFWVADAL